MDLLALAQREHAHPPHLARKINRLVGRCIQQWNLIEEGDRILVGISGGKDSYALLDVLLHMQRVAPIHFDLLAFHLDQGHPNFPTHVIRDHLATLPVEFVIHRQDTYSIVVDKLEPGQTTCSLCSRLRRGILYTEAVARGCNKIALGHHRDDAIETLLLNLFYAGQIKAMPAKLRSDDGRNTVIRPLLQVPEAWLVAYAEQMAFPIVPCTLCSRQPDLKRDAMTQLLDALEADNRNVRGNLLAALGNVAPSHLLDRDLFDPDAHGFDAETLIEEVDVKTRDV